MSLYFLRQAVVSSSMQLLFLSSWQGKDFARLGILLFSHKCSDNDDNTTGNSMKINVSVEWETRFYNIDLRKLKSKTQPTLYSPKNKTTNPAMTSLFTILYTGRYQ